MAIVLYKCDVCKREIELQRNITGVDTPQRCKITSGCRGKLYQQKVLQGVGRGRTPADVRGLDNWQQRKILYNHTQSIEAQEWVVSHNLGTAPSVSVFVKRPTSDDPGNLQEITPTDSIVVNADVIRLVFDRPEAGIAQMVGRASDPHLLNPFVREGATVLETLQVTVTGELTIATRTSAPAVEPSQIGVELTYTTTDGVQVPVQYTASDQPAITSPWTGFTKVVVNGKVFTVRSFNIIVRQQASGIITNGSSVRLTGVDTGAGFRDVVANEMIILLASPPFDDVDRITTQYIDGASVVGDANPFAFFFDTGNLVADETIFQKIHPPIRSI